MKTDGFVHLHVHDEYSMLDGAADTGKLVRRAAELGQTAIAQTNHGNMFGSFRFHKECVAAGVTPIIGMEAYCAPWRRTHKHKIKWGTPDQGRLDISGGGSYTHLTLLARTASGVRNLFRLTSESFASGFYSKPRIDLELLAGHQDGLLIGSGCLGGELQTRLSLGQIEEAHKYVRQMKDMFGDSFFIEVMEHGIPRERDNLKVMVRMAKVYGIPLVATNDSHYITPDDHLLHDAMLCLQTFATLEDEKRMRFDGDGYHIKSRAEMERLGLPQEALNNTLWVAGQVEDVSAAFTGTHRMPASGDPDPEATLRKMCYDNRYSSTVVAWTPAYDERLEYELDVICSQQFADYFLVLSDIVRYARSQGIRVGPGRGSAVGSLVAYLVGITELDPISNGLLFERFLNSERISLPDIDVDFQKSRRDEIIEYAIGKYGTERCARIGTIGTIQGLKALRDSARVLGRPYDVGTRLTWSLPKPKVGIMPPLSEADMSKVEDLEAFALATQLEGLARAPGVHASGFIISPVPISEVLPTFVPERKNDAAATQFDMHAVEDLGLVKLDFLGLTALDVIDDALRMCDSGLPDGFTDQATFRLLQSGDTLGVFQMDGVGMRALLKRMGVRTLGDVAACIALYRPGPMGASAHNDYADRLNGKHSVSYPHPEFSESLKDILGPTYGVLVYQEQVMHTLQRVCGYSLAEADLVRKAMGKKDRALLAAEYSRYYQGGKSNGYSDSALQTLWDILTPFADYAFNKAHATAYAWLAFRLAWLKANHPKEFFAALLTHENDPDKLPEYLAEVRRMGIPILPPSVNGGPTWTPSEKGIHYGLTSIKGVGDKVAAPLLRAAPYVGWSDYLRRAPKAALNTGVVKALISAGALDGVLDGQSNREGLLSVFESHLGHAVTEREELKNGESGFLRRTYEVPGFPVDYAKRAGDEQLALGVRLSYPPVVLRTGRALQAVDWAYLRRVLESIPGEGVCVVRTDEWSMRLSLRVDSDRVKRAVSPLGITVE